MEVYERVGYVGYDRGIVRKYNEGYDLVGQVRSRLWEGYEKDILRTGQNRA